MGLDEPITLTLPPPLLNNVFILKLTKSHSSDVNVQNNCVNIKLTSYTQKIKVITFSDAAEGILDVEAAVRITCRFSPKHYPIKEQISLY